MAAYTDIDLDFLRQFCDIREVKSLAEFLFPGHLLSTRFVYNRL